MLTNSPVWTAAGWTMLHMVWVGAAIGLVAALARRLLKPVRPEVRYGVALVCLLGLWVSPAAIFIRVFEPDSGPGIAIVRAVRTSKPASSGSSAISDRVLPARAEVRVVAVTLPTSDLQRSRLDLLVPYLPWIWLTGSLSTVVMLATGLVGVEQLRRSSRLVEVGDLPRRCRTLADSLGIARRVGVGICDRLAAPILLGIIRPLILLPPAALSGWNVDQLEMVLLHELAHLRRWDNLVNLLQRVVESLLFFHPVVWWLSGWVRLERELCCDRFVVERLGQPFAYAEMLVALSGSSHRGRPIVLAMADRQVLTRVRRLFNLEDRSLKLTMPEGLGLLGMVIVGAALALGSHAGQPKPAGESEESIRQALRKAVEDVKKIPRDHLENDLTVMTLTDIARAQLELGDRTSALATLQRAFEAIDHFDPKKGDLEVVGTLPEVAKYQREAGDLAAARATLNRMIKLVESLKDFSRVEKIIQLTGTEQPRRVQREMGAIVRCELLMVIAEERIALGDRDEARTLYQRAVEAIRPQNDLLNPMVLAGIGSRLYKAGDAALARNMIEQARKAASELTNPEDKDGAMPYVAQAMADIGDLDGALALVQTLGKHGKPAAVRMIIVSFFAADDFHGAWLDPGGIKIVIGAEPVKLKDRAATRQAMPKIAQAVRGTGDTLLQVRMLSVIANLQAKAGDFTGARQTADSIPNIKRKDFPGPSDGFYDAIKPATVAINARLQAEAGDKVGASEGLRQAISLSRSVETADQKMVAQIVIAQKQIECGDHDGARALIQEAIPIALTLPEPLRSRSLAMLVESQVKAGDAAGATRTTSAIRDYPGLEKLRALGALADCYEKVGDAAAAQTFLRQKLHIAEAKVPENAPTLPGKIGPPQAVAARSFAQFEYELDPRMIEHQKQMVSLFLHARLGDSEGALRLARAMPAGARDVALGNLAGDLARRGDVAGALKLAESLETPDERLAAFDLTACAIRDRNTSK